MTRFLTTTALGLLIGGAALAAPRLQAPSISDTLTPLPASAHESCDEDDQDENGECSDGEDDDDSDDDDDNDSDSDSDSDDDYDDNG